MIYNEKVAERILFDLAIALVYFSKGKLNPQEAEKLAKKTLSEVDLDSPHLSHKGLNWIAKETLKRHKINV